MIELEIEARRDPNVTFLLPSSPPNLNLGVLILITVD